MRRGLKISLGFVIGIAFIVWFALRLNWAKVWAVFLTANIGLILTATLLVSSTYLIRSFRWRTLLTLLKRASLADLFAANAIGFGAIFLLGRTGEFVRPVVASMRTRIKFTATLATILIERVFDSMTVSVIFSLGLIFFNYNRSDFASTRIIRDLLPIGYILIAGHA